MSDLDNYLEEVKQGCARLGYSVSDLKQIVRAGETVSAFVQQHSQRQDVDGLTAEEVRRRVLDSVWNTAYALDVDPSAIVDMFVVGIHATDVFRAEHVTSSAAG